MRLGGVNQWGRSVGDDPRGERRQPAVDRSSRRSGHERDGFFRHYNAPLERPSLSSIGISVGPGSRSLATSRSSMWLDQYVADLDELVDVVRGRFGKERSRSSATPGARRSA